MGLNNMTKSGSPGTWIYFSCKDVHNPSRIWADHADVIFPWSRFGNGVPKVA